jgi:pyruvate dehydrogenase E2 component (dihydrolipoamide acetyltransferase)
MSTVEVKVPDIGDFSEVAIIELLVKPGDTVAVEQSLITVESDKASMEIPSSHAGVVKDIKVGLGQKVSEGSVVLVLEVAGHVVPEISDQKTAPALVDKEQTAPVFVAAPAAQPAAAPVVASSPVEVRVPDIGDFKDVAVIEVFVKPGDSVKVEQSLITVESDKASMEIPSSHAGVVQELKVKIGDKLNIGDLIALLQGAQGPGAVVVAAPAASAQKNESKVAPALASQVQAAPVSVAPPQPAHNPTTAPVGLPHASPSVRQLAREFGVPLTEVKGSGPKGRITAQDVQVFTRGVMNGVLQTTAIATAVAQQVAAAKPAPAAGGGGGELGLIPWPKVDFAKFGPIERKEMGRIKKISGANLLRNAVMIPAVTNHDDADITDLEAFRVLTNKENEKSGIKVTMLAFLIKACVSALKKFPEFNSSLDGDALVYKNYWHIGFAADTPNGLMVPVIKNADQKGIFQISQEMSELAKKARDGKLGPADMSGATFTISSLGGIGGRYFTPIINAPEVAILGVCKSQMEPVWNGKEFVPRLMLPLSLTWDHRVIDGASAARFNAYLGHLLADFRRIML